MKIDSLNDKCLRGTPWCECSLSNYSKHLDSVGKKIETSNYQNNGEGNCKEVNWE